jgi:ribosomal protein S18 acetylase RimI-like enzyme
MERYKKTDEYKGQKNKRFWLEVSKDNVAAMKTYEKLGFEFERDGSGPDKAILTLLR